MKNVRGLLGTMLVWSGPAAMAGMGVASTIQSWGDSLGDGFVFVMMSIATLTVVTAPLGAYLRRGTRWTPAARFARRQARPINRFSVFDAALLFGVVWGMMGVLSLAPSTWRVFQSARRDWKELIHDTNTLGRWVSALVLIVPVVAVLVTGVRFQFELLGGFWYRTVWGRRRIAAIRAETPGYSADAPAEPVPSRIIAVYGVGIAFLFVCMIVLAASVAYQLSR